MKWGEKVQKTSCEGFFTTVILSNKKVQLELDWMRKMWI